MLQLLCLGVLVVCAAPAQVGFIQGIFMVCEQELRVEGPGKHMFEMWFNAGPPQWRLALPKCFPADHACWDGNSERS